MRTNTTDLRIVDIRKKAVQTALSLTSGAYQTSLVSYFTHRDLFPALMKVIKSLSIRSYVLSRGSAGDDSS